MKKTALMAAMVQTYAVLTGMAWAADKGAASPSAVAPMVFAAVFVLALYFTPAIIGFSRKKDNKSSILLLNLFLGWSLIGWVVALIWATSKDKVTVQHIYVQQSPPAQSGNQSE